MMVRKIGDKVRYRPLAQHDGTYDAVVTGFRADGSLDVEIVAVPGIAILALSKIAFCKTTGDRGCVEPEAAQDAV